MPTIELKNCSKRYGKAGVLALDHFNQSFSPGIYGILGPNGAGKSTLFNILSGTLSMTEGSLIFDGQPVEKNWVQYKKHLGFMPQQQNLYPDMTPASFLQYMAVLKAVPGHSIKDELERVLHLTQLESKRYHKIQSLSGGMKQRLLISQALLGDPELLILDEPTAGLDPSQRVVIRNLLSDLSREKIVLISTHVVSDIELISREILLMKKGRCIVRGRLPEILQKYADISWEIITDEAGSQEAEDSYAVSRVQILADAGIRLRIVGSFDSPPQLQGQSFEPVEPTLEDIYLYLFQEDVRHA